MHVTIKGEAKNLPVSTITLQPEEGDNIYSFHCLNCGNFHQQIGGKVSKIYPIYEPSNQVPVVSTCRNCGYKYNFQTHDGYETNEVKVILHPLQTTNTFYCYKGKTKMLEYTAKVIVSVQDDKHLKPPFKAECPDIYCRAMYFFSDLM